MQLNSVNRGWFHELKERMTFILQRVKKKLFLCREGIGGAVSLLCLIPTGRWLSSADTDAAVGLPCTSDFLALGSFCSCTHPPLVSSPFKVSTTIPIQSLHSHSRVRRELCENTAVYCVYNAGEAPSSMKSLQFTVKRGCKRVSGGNCIAEHCRWNWEFLLWSPVVKKLTKDHLTFSSQEVRQGRELASASARWN